MRVLRSSINDMNIVVSYQSIRDLLTRHKAVAAEFLEQEFDQVMSYHFPKRVCSVCSNALCLINAEQVFSKYKSLLRSENYVTRRMSLKMLGELLLDRSNFNTM